MKLLTSKDSNVQSYGIIITEEIICNTDRNKIIDWMNEKTRLPDKGDVYVADLKEFEELNLRDTFNSITGLEELQFGYCHGHNEKVNALEWHKGPEVIVALTECVLFLGLHNDIISLDGKYTYDTEKLISLRLGKGEIIKLHNEVLHYAPVQVDKNGFMTMIILPKGTNEQLEASNESNLDEYLFMKNKWLIAHEDSQDLIKDGACLGVVGINLNWSLIK